MATAVRRFVGVPAGAAVVVTLAVEIDVYLGTRAAVLICPALFAAADRRWDVFWLDPAAYEAPPPVEAGASTARHELTGLRWIVTANNGLLVLPGLTMLYSTFVLSALDALGAVVPGLGAVVLPARLDWLVIVFAWAYITVVAGFLLAGLLRVGDR